jgi:uncharacterized protein YbcV (DUF1398 family)
MTPQTKDIVIECTKASDEERISFPQVVAKLMQAGVERYHADLERSEKTYYLPNGDSEVVPSVAIHTELAQEFSADGVAAAIKAIQSGAIQYKEFCVRVMAAGCVGYLVSLAGRRAVYYGRTGDMHVEWFPGART